MTNAFRKGLILSLSALALLMPSTAIAQGKMTISVSDGKPPTLASPTNLLVAPGGGYVRRPAYPRNSSRQSAPFGRPGIHTVSGGSARCRPDYVLRFCLFATRNLTFNGNADTQTRSSSAGRSGRGVERNPAILGCYGKADVERSQVFEEADGFKYTTGGFRFAHYGAPPCPPHPVLPLLPVLRPSANKRVIVNPEVKDRFFETIHPAENEIYDLAALIKKNSRGGEARLTLGKGDYICSGIVAESLQVVPKERVRLFLTDNANADGYAFLSAVNSTVGASTFDSGKAADFQIWYNGQGTIKLDHNTHFCGIIYAPNARVEMGTGNCMFEGAVVARDIIVGGNTSVTYDEDLARTALDR